MKPNRMALIWILLFFTSHIFSTGGSLSIPPIIVVFPSGNVLLRWQYPPSAAGIDNSNGDNDNHSNSNSNIDQIRQFNITITTADPSSAGNNISQEHYKDWPSKFDCGTELFSNGFCLKLPKMPSSIEMSLIYKNGTETAVETTSFQQHWNNMQLGKAHHHNGSTSHGGANKTIEEMFHDLKSDIGQIHKQNELLDYHEHLEEQTTRSAITFTSIMEAIAVIGTILVTLLGLAVRFGLHRLGQPPPAAPRNEAIQLQEGAAAEDPPEENIINMEEGRENANLI